MGAVGDWFYNAVYEPISDEGAEWLGQEDEKIHDRKIANSARKAAEAAAAQKAAAAPGIAAKKAAEEARRKAELRTKRLSEGGRTSTFHSVDSSPLAGISVEDTLGGY